jgi:hypothetical protein
MKHLFLHCTTDDIDQVLPLAGQHGFGLELTSFSHPPLLEQPAELVARHRQWLDGFTGMRSIHGAFYHLIPGAIDPLIREATAVRMLIFRIEAPTEKARQLGHLIRSGASELHMAMPNLREKKNFRLVTEHIKEINTIENNGDRILREALVEIVAHKDDIFNLIRWKEIYEMLEETTDTMEDVADVLQRVVIKNG